MRARKAEVKGPGEVVPKGFLSKPAPAAEVREAPAAELGAEEEQTKFPYDK